MSTKSLVLMTLALVMACASAGGSGTGTGTHRDPNVITEQDIAASTESNAFDVVSKLRPMFLKTRGRTSINAAGSPYAMVFLDSQLYGEIASLRNIVADQIHEIRYLSGPEAVGKYGNRFGSGAIDVRIK